MKIGIIGLGYVGSAVAATHKHHEIVVRDPKLNQESASLDCILQCDAIYICVPSPMNDDGSCNVEYIEAVLEEIQNYSKVIIAKSTLPPDFYKKLQLKFHNLVHVPEFLTAANAVNDYEQSAWVLVGGEEPFVEYAIDVIRSSSIVAKKYVKTNIATASMFKYIANSFLATKVTYMNDMYHLANQLDISWNDIKEISKNDSRLGDTHWDVPGPDGLFGYGGACFPKDVSAIIEHAKSFRIELSLLESVKQINKKHRN
jgi:UDPglucose 6-dehydrogenase